MPRFWGPICRRRFKLRTLETLIDRNKPRRVSSSKWRKISFVTIGALLAISVYLIAVRLSLTRPPDADQQQSRSAFQNDPTAKENRQKRQECELTEPTPPCGDIMFLIESSVNIGDSVFDAVKQFVLDVASLMPVDSEVGVLFAGGVWSSQPLIELVGLADCDEGGFSQFSAMMMTANNIHRNESSYPDVMYDTLLNYQYSLMLPAAQTGRSEMVPQLAVIFTTGVFSNGRSDPTWLSGQRDAVKEQVDLTTLSIAIDVGGTAVDMAAIEAMAVPDGAMRMSDGLNASRDVITSFAQCHSWMCSFQPNTTTANPTTAMPTTETPITETPTTETPTSETPTSETPTSETPTETPTTETPTSETPESETPTSETPESETPTNEIPTSETPTSETLTSATPTSATPTNATPATTTPTKIDVLYTHWQVLQSFKVDLIQTVKPSGDKQGTVKTYQKQRVRVNYVFYPIET